MLIFSEVLTMKHTFKTLLVLVLVVFVLAGCSNPAGPEIEVPVVEAAEDNTRFYEVRFEWGKDPKGSKDYFDDNFPRYFSDLHKDEQGNYVYEYPEMYNDFESYYKLMNNTEDFEKFSSNVFETVFGTKTYEEGYKICLEQWTSKAIDLVRTSEELNIHVSTCLYFLTERVEEPNELSFENSLNEIIVDKNITVYIYWNTFDE